MIFLQRLSSNENFELEAYVMHFHFMFAGDTLVYTVFQASLPDWFFCSSMVEHAPFWPLSLGKQRAYVAERLIIKGCFIIPLSATETLCPARIVAIITFVLSSYTGLKLGTPSHVLDVSPSFQSLLN